MRPYVTHIIFIVCLTLYIVFITTTKLMNTHDQEISPQIPFKQIFVQKKNVFSRRLPKAIIIGSKKSGTSALVNYLYTHPDLKFPRHEVHFFDHEYMVKKGLEYYRRRMVKSLPHQITMEKTPRYFVEKEVPGLVFEALGKDMKFILCLRDPVDRLHSDYNFMRNMLKAELYRKKTLDELLFLPNSTTVNKGFPPVRVSSYDDNIRRWLQYYPLDRFLLIENKDLDHKPLSVLNQVEDFLGVKRHFTPWNILRRQKSSWKHKHKYQYMSNSTRRILVDYFRPHSLNFFKIWNRTFDWQLYWE